MLITRSDPAVIDAKSRDMATIRNFYRKMLCIARTVLSQDVRLSVRHMPVFYRNS